MDPVERPVAPYASGEHMNVGDVFAGQYRLEGVLGEGATAVVHAARDVESGRPVALKIVQDHVGGAEVNAMRFRREVEILQKLGHAGVVEVLDFSHDPDGPLYLVMERLEGDTLEDVMVAGSASRYALLTYVRALLEPLTAAHEAGVVHRDLKPSNVFLRWASDGSVKTKLIDFGIARADGAARVTPPEGTVGTPSYMSPEQATSPEAASFSSDLWAVGVLMYQVVAHRSPFVGATAFEVIVQACTQPHPPLSEVAPGTSPKLEALIDQCLAKEPADRPSSARELAEQLDLLLADPKAKTTLLAPKPGLRGNSGRRAAVEGERSGPAIETPPGASAPSGRAAWLLIGATLVAAAAALVVFLR